MDLAPPQAELILVMAEAMAALVVALVVFIFLVAEELAVIQEMAVTAHVVHIQVVPAIPVLGVQAVQAVHGYQITHPKVLVVVGVWEFWDKEQAELGWGLKRAATAAVAAVMVALALPAIAPV